MTDRQDSPSGEEKSGKGGRKWLLIETFTWPDGDVSIVNWGGRPRAFLPVTSALTRSTVARVSQAIATVAETREPLSMCSQGYRVEAVPHLVRDRLHGIQFWCGRDDDPVPEKPLVAAWRVDFTTKTALGSPEWAEMADLPPEERGQAVSLATVFAQATTDHRESVALQRIVAARAGETNQGFWTIKRRDGTQWQSHWSHGTIEEQIDGETHRIGLGLSQKVQEPEPVVLEHRILEASTNPDEYQAIVALDDLTLIRWVHGTTPPNMIAWRRIPHEPEPAVHPDDRPAMLAMARGLTKSPTHGSLRLRGVDGQWVRIDARADPVALDNTISAALVRFTIADQT
ncbi:DUF5593 domain-containing protein [Nocardia terpenica]|uniref:GAF domain-containing protein n=1 Tax=Nocardia terpenica TaxID=455432 RepID=UPI001895E721|nr:GAF domain-containing protein [Nocardia terpenica]MBF6059217.1 DUF5593 domain-containing protein [Nocardia terpenica]MBF6103244.1 DUF5593 domain-containing protein [Nocardia terpenica]MBF6110567.1 DUF5593 domain-containing protein [Nocardia terpenica]MBF6116698.1 DUF5593 domain-containing protein [Nocardia terpenica]